MAGGEQPPKRLSESSCGDFHSLPQVLLKPPDMKDSVSFLPVPPSPAPGVSDLRKPGLLPTSGGFHLEGRE